MRLRRRRAVDRADLLATLARTAARLRTADDSTETRSLLCREAVTLADGDGAVLYLAGPGRLLAAAGYGNHPRPPRGELEVDARVERAVRQGTIEAEPDLLVVPVLGESVVLGAVAIYGACLPADAAADALRVFAHLAGSVFERFGSVVEDGAQDPVTGVGEHRRGAAALASVRPGDGVVVCELDGIRPLRVRDPAAAVLAQGQLGLRLRNADTAETASRMMVSARSAGIGQLYVAPVGS